MIKHTYILIGTLVLLGAEAVVAAPQVTPVPLSERGQILQAQYAAELTDLQAKFAKVIPAFDPVKKTAFEEAQTAVRKAVAEAEAAQKPLLAIQSGKGLVDHAKGKWIGGADKGIAAAEAKLKAATTPEDRAAAQMDLEKWQKNKVDGLAALAQREAALAVAIENEAQKIQADAAAKAALAAARANELQAAKAMSASVLSFLSSEKYDPNLVKCAVLANATPKGLAEFAGQGVEQETLVNKLLANPALMKAMLEAGGAKAGRYGQAMQIYSGIQKASPKAREGILHRLALGTSLEHALPVGQQNAVSEKNAPTIVDPIQRYLHYEKAYLAGELDPAFKNMSAWECRMIVNSYAPDHILAWGREMLRNYRPDHIYNADQGWRYSGIVGSDATYRHSNEYTDTDSLHLFQNIVKNGGICGRRAFLGRYICRSFGIPAWGVAQHAHGAVGRWTPSGWVVNYGAGWDVSWGPPEETESGRRGWHFLLETQARRFPADYLQVLRAQWTGDALGEAKYNSSHDRSGGPWNVLALFQQRLIVAEAKPAELAALGTELGEANESAEAKARAVAKATVTEADRKILIASNGVITVPAAACKGTQLTNSYLGGQQMTCGGSPFSFEIDVARAGKYRIDARVVTLRDVTLQFNVNNAPEPIAFPLPYTIGRWQQTIPVEVTLVQGKNTFKFSKPPTSATIKDFTLTPVN
ncbi:MAG: hypothetical protein V4727_07275 [Verrucomicrobiota bacterium]